MENIEIKFANQIIEVSCNNPKQVINLAEKVNNIIEQVKQDNPNATSTKVAFLTTLILQDKLDDIQQQLSKNQLEQFNLNSLKKANTDLIEIIENIVSYLENVIIQLEQLQKS